MLVGKDVAMVTYGNEDVADGPRRSKRMSLWDRAGGRWQLLFHQETALPASNAWQILRWARHNRESGAVSLGALPQLLCAALNN